MHGAMLIVTALTCSVSVLSADYGHPERVKRAEGSFHRFFDTLNSVLSPNMTKRFFACAQNDRKSEGSSFGSLYVPQQQSRLYFHRYAHFYPAHIDFCVMKTAFLTGYFLSGMITYIVEKGRRFMCQHFKNFKINRSFARNVYC